MKKKILSFLGKALTVLSLVFIVVVVLKFDIDFTIIIKPKVLIGILICSIILASSVVFNSIAWSKLLNVFTHQKLILREVIDVYSKANLGKYLPGNIMHYVSRNVYGSKYGISQKDMVYATVMEVALKVVSAGIISLLFLNKRISSILEQIQVDLSISISFVVTGIAIIVIMIGGIVFWRFRSIGLRSLKPIGCSMILYSVIFLINAGVFIAATNFISNTVTGDVLLYATGIYIIAWLIGYLAPGAPGGIGIKEGIMILLLSNIYSLEVITLVSVIVRIITVIADILAYIMNLTLSKHILKSST